MDRRPDLQDEAEANWNGLRDSPAMLWNADRREQKATQRTTGAEGCQTDGRGDADVHAAAGGGIYRLPILREGSRHCRRRDETCFFDGGDDGDGD